MKKLIKNILNKLPYIKTLANDVSIYKKGYPPGHYYSPVISIDEIKQHEEKIFSINSNLIPGIELYEEEQMKLLEDLLPLYATIPFDGDKKEGLRYYFNNTVYTYSDAVFLNLLIRKFKPKRIIEVGSGFSSAVMLDTNELFFNNSIDLTFIEPYPERLYSLFKENDKNKNKVLVSNLQTVDIELFKHLESGDFLFIDSTHVSKTGSDVNTVFFEILPVLKKGVLIHIHDIFYPFEYPKEWVTGWSGFGWNEGYLLRAFLMHNKDYEIIMFNTYMEHFHEEWFKKNMPLCLLNRGGSIWLKKVTDA